jgi:hypothetical protein
VTLSSLPSPGRLVDGRPGRFLGTISMPAARVKAMDKKLSANFETA